MPVGSVGSSLPPQMLAALDAISSAQTAELQTAMQLEQGLQATSVAIDPNLGQLVNLTV